MCHGSISSELDNRFPFEKNRKIYWLPGKFVKKFPDQPTEKMAAGAKMALRFP
jgi:hypothetical protein